MSLIVLIRGKTAVRTSRKKRSPPLLGHRESPRGRALSISVLFPTRVFLKIRLKLCVCSIPFFSVLSFLLNNVTFIHIIGYFLEI